MDCSYYHVYRPYWSDYIRKGCNFCLQSGTFLCIFLWYQRLSFKTGFFYSSNWAHFLSYFLFSLGRRLLSYLQQKKICSAPFPVRLYFRNSFWFMLSWKNLGIFLSKCHVHFAYWFSDYVGNRNLKRKKRNPRYHSCCPWNFNRISLSCRL